MIGRRIGIPIVVAASIAVGGVAGALLGVPGLSGAASTGSTQANKALADPAEGPHARAGRAGLDAAAKALNLTTDELLQKLSDGKTTIADIAAQEKIDLNTVIDAIAKADRRRIEDFVNNPLPARDRGNGKGGMGFMRPFGIGDELDAAAKTLGMSTQDLLKDLRDGKSIAQVAQDKHVDVNDVIGAMVTAGSARIDKAKDAGKLTPAQADNLKSRLKDMATRAVNGELGPRGGNGFGDHGGRFGPGPGGPGGSGNGGAPPSTESPAG